MFILAVTACSSERDVPDGASNGVHASGILDETSEAFHGKELARRGWDLGLCATCHGDDFRGGASGTSCVTCHAKGPDACETCHREGTFSGAHAIHAAAEQDCAECHVVPSRWDAQGHILDDAPPAEVTFGARAAVTLDPSDRAGAPSYAAGTCANVYCHGDVLHAGGGTATQPRWTDPAIGGCASCHASPPPSHAQDNCATCHRDAPHIDGALQVGDACNSCHGDAMSPAPPRDLAGNQFTTAIGVGAHRAHLAGASRLRAPLACAECHLVPADVGATGHLDSALPAEVVLASGAWDRSSASCTTYCHGDSTPVWTASGQVFCGSCHGVPPSSHAPATIDQCATCHPRSVDEFGNILVGGEHLDGGVDVF